MKNRYFPGNWGLKPKEGSNEVPEFPVFSQLSGNFMRDRIGVDYNHRHFDIRGNAQPVQEQRPRRE
jgi:hypothetical protein